MIYRLKNSQKLTLLSFDEKFIDISEFSIEVNNIPLNLQQDQGDFKNRIYIKNMIIEKFNLLMGFDDIDDTLQRQKFIS